jgi:hypothetical protein
LRREAGDYPLFFEAGARALAFSAVLGLASPAIAAAPFVTDDPNPTNTREFEIYAFNTGANTEQGTSGANGIELSYGGAKDLQLTVIVPHSFDLPREGASTAGFGNIELGAKYRFLHQEDVGVDVAVAAHFFFPSISTHGGDRHSSFFLPLYIDRSWDDERWLTYAGGGCTINQGGGSQNFCQIGWVLTHQFTARLNMGIEIHHETADTIGGKASTGIDVGAVYDISDTYHLMASGGPGIQNAAETNRFSWYAALLATF